MSTTPISAGLPSLAPRTAQAAGPETRNYHKPGFPVLSFSYALYCDAAFSLANFKIWVAERDLGRDYRGYLEPYRWDQQRRFPMLAMEIIAADVPNQGVPEPSKDVPEPGNTRYRPTEAQSQDLMVYLLAEITGAPEVPMATGEHPPTAAALPPSKRLPAEVNNQRPLLSCLAVIFMNEDPTFRISPEKFLAAYGLTRGARDVLTEFGKGASKFLTPTQGQALVPDLVAEFINPPACW